MSDNEPAAIVQYRGWGLVAKILGGCLLLLAGLLFLSLVVDVLSDDSEIMKNVVGNVLLFVALVGSSFLLGRAFLRWGRRQRMGDSAPEPSTASSLSIVKTLKCFTPLTLGLALPSFINILQHRRGVVRRVDSGLIGLQSSGHTADARSPGL